ncbi:Flp pilus assembly protein CpaB [Mangrovibrevibacter kandeliae]|uniref:Flp pilus assembly protein CpaB n=1 Tax=Mangrovibrevibacter kandeliae TaxID=2968473 RepID=UPI0021176AE0|nr:MULTISPECIES: Flp pilus assembly protein CpaB [unclassified Aurantimonas]MCQ8783517.1 Flp pilus assembly protein CpaB [Aurantimonas sp. CSK15Z-1]MCW4115967.1 Flp pilus assembly protein CpaB [Aurantimonas sp. MSK8Z-1]
MRLARLAVMGVAVVAAVAAGTVALNLSSTEQPESVIISAAPVEPPIRLTDVLVTTKEIPMGGLIDGALDWQSWPADNVASSFILKSQRPNAITELKGSLARQSFFPSEPVRESKLVKSDHGFMSAILPAGSRAVAVQISADTSAGGFILPNDHVDMIMARRRATDASAGTGGATQYDTETILHNLRVLAIDQTIEEKDGEKVVVGSTATLEVTPEQAEAVTVAQQMADRLVLSLRSLSDSVPGGSGYTASMLQDDQSRNAKIRIVRFGLTSDITTKK